MNLYVLYDHPLDYPSHVIIRRWEVTGDIAVPTPKEVVFQGDDLDSCRDFIDSNFPDLVCLARSDQDDPKIIETWV